MIISLFFTNPIVTFHFVVWLKTPLIFWKNQSRIFESYNEKVLFKVAIVLGNPVGYEIKFMPLLAF